MAQTLKNVVKKLNKMGFDGNVYIGGATGSGYFYIGPYDKDIVQELYLKQHEKVKNARSTAEEELNYYISQPIKLRDQLNEKGEVEKTVLILQLEIASTINHIANQVKKYMRYEKAFKNDVEEVKVKEFYPKQDINEPGWIILLADMCQRGEYWIAKESSYAKGA